MAMSVRNIEYTKEPYFEDEGACKVKSIQFSLFSEAEILKEGVVEVWRGVYYDSSTKPMENGLLDLRMGPANKSCICATCHGRFIDCPGHYGYLPLALPVFNAGYLGTILSILKCICKKCSRILLEESLRQEYLKKMRSPRIDAHKKAALAKQITLKCSTMASSKKSVLCSRCGFMNGIVKKAPTGKFGIVHERSKVNDSDLKQCNAAISHTRESNASFKIDDLFTPIKVLMLFKMMIDEDCELLYLFDRPEKLIMANIAVPPLPIRPSVVVAGRDSNENDITGRLKRIMEANAALKQLLLEPSSKDKCLENWDHLQLEVAHYINSDVRGFPPQAAPGSKVLSGFVQRLKGKQGRFRGNLSGKRVEYTGRTVISPDPNLKISEVAIPVRMAIRLSYPERVYSHNLAKLKQCVRNGDRYPGAIMISYPDGSKRMLSTHARKRFADELEVGCIVHRHLEDGDIVLFNRQPSLHRMSLMCHRARILPWRTLRFNESVCNPYNADFDGDEMNLHVPQTEEARTEALLLMGVQNNLCTPKNGEILVASTQDFLTSSFLITRKDTFYDRSTFSLMCSYMGDSLDTIDLPTPTIIKPTELWTGKQIFNVLLRPNADFRVYVNLTSTEKGYDPAEKQEDKKNRKTRCPSDGYVYFRNSELISGQVGKATLGNGNKEGLFSVLLRDYNEHAAAYCMNRLAKLSARWIGNHGFSIGIDDVQPGKELYRMKGDEIKKGYKYCDDLILKYKQGALTLHPGSDAAQTLEAMISRELNEIRGKAAKVCERELHWRNSPLIMALCGSKGSAVNISQMIACVGQQSVGGRRAVNGFIDRSLPHFLKNTNTPAAKGFVANSFYSGLTATEFFFHTMAGREGLVDTAVKTADTGYMSRRLMKALEDLSIHYDDTVRSANGSIVQFRYGDDGMDPAQMEDKSGSPVNFERLFLRAKATCPPVGAYLSPLEIDRLAEWFVKDATACGGDSAPRSDSDTPSQVHCSVAFRNSLSRFLKGLADGLRKTRKNMGLQEDCIPGIGDIQDIVVQNIFGISKNQLQVFLSTCISRYHSKRVEGGTAIGAIGAQSIGEPGTQMTLKTFHFAGLASMNITLGVPRIKEIINGAKNISTPIITAVLECSENENIARRVKNCIEKRILSQVSKSIKIVISSRIAKIVIKLDKERISALNFHIDGRCVKDAILRTPRIKLKDENIRDLGCKLEIIPHVDKSKILYELHSLKNTLAQVLVKGIKCVQRVVIKKEVNKRSGKQEYELLAEGKGLQAVMGIEGVDGRKTTSNDILEVYQTLGIEAARKCIINEIHETMHAHGMTIDKRHMMLLADLMTCKGDVLGITRFGIQRMKDSVLMLASFEKTADHLFNASVNGREDMIEGVSECIIMGKPMQMGTGVLKVAQRHPIPLLNYGADPMIS